jgi:hypothetical protein
MPGSSSTRVITGLDWRVNRVDVTAEQAHDYLADLPRRAAEHAIRERVAKVRCPVHRKGARLVAARGPGNELEFGVLVCCPELEMHLGSALNYRSGPGLGRIDVN